MVKMVLFNLIVTLVFFSCQSKMEYSNYYVSATTAKFNSYKNEVSNRPSPPARTRQEIENVDVFITYSQPSVKGRQIWGNLVKYNKIWRTGANEATVLSTDKALLVEGDTLEAGNYALYTIPSEEEWEVIFNEKYNVWGAYDYDQSLDVIRFKVRPNKSTDFKEKMTFEINNSGRVQFSWEYLSFQFNVSKVSNS